MIAYSGNGAYCYANSLHMCLRAAGAAYLPDPDFIECLTLMPFGAGYGDTLGFFPSPARIDPDVGLSLALKHAGWTCHEWSLQQRSADALTKLTDVISDGPALIGPLDMNRLSYHPRRGGGVADHYIVVLGKLGRRFTVHDPAGYPFAEIPEEDLVAAWSVDAGYAEPCTLRCEFQQSETVTRQEMTDRTVSALREMLSAQPETTSPVEGSAALRLVSEKLRRQEAPPSLRSLPFFGLHSGPAAAMTEADFYLRRECRPPLRR